MSYPAIHIRNQILDRDVPRFRIFMSLTLLFDLDDTLLDTNLDAFVPAYFQALSQHMAGRVDGGEMLRALVAGTSSMNENEDSTRTLQEAFESSFYRGLAIPKPELFGLMENFFDEVFPLLEKYTKPKKEAVPLVNWAFSSGFRIAIATDPLFPYQATYHRLRWAGFDPERFELISTFENFHFTKAHPAYYAEMLGRLGWQDGPVLVVGNNVSRDLIPANRLGLKTYLIETESALSPGRSDAAQDKFEAGRGKLADLRPWLESVDLSTLEPSYTSREAILAILQATPAVLHSLFASLRDDECRHEPARDDWAFNEILCHLRDTEREVHQLQLELLLEKEDAFIPRPDTSVWANERDYLHEDGRMAIADFARARLDNLNTLKILDDDVWSRKARHAIFGPTDFLEIMSFAADHDRMHLQQAWKTLQSVQAGASN